MGDNLNPFSTLNLKDVKVDQAKAGLDSSGTPPDSNPFSTLNLKDSEALKDVLKNAPVDNEVSASKKKDADVFKGGEANMRKNVESNGDAPVLSQMELRQASAKKAQDAAKLLLGTPEEQAKKEAAQAKKEANELRKTIDELQEQRLAQGRTISSTSFLSLFYKKRLTS